MKSIVLLLLSLSAAYAASQSTRSYVPFSWSSCGTSSDPIQIVSMTLTPSPIVFGDNITVSATVKVNQEITGTTIFSLSLQQVLAVAVDLTLEKQIIGWINIPCVDNIGSCSYGDVCPMLANVTCPSLFTEYDLPCNCPVAVGTYTLPLMTVGPVPEPPSYLDWLTDGNYRATVKLTDPDNNDESLIK